MDKFTRKRSAARRVVDSSSEEEDEDVRSPVDVPVVDKNTKRSSPLKRSFGLLKFENGKMHLGRKSVTFADDAVYRSAVNHFSKNISNAGSVEDTPPLDDIQRIRLNQSLKRAKILLTSHSDYDKSSGLLKLIDDHTYTNPVRPRKKKRVKREGIEEEEEDDELDNHISGELQEIRSQLTSFKDYMEKALQEQSKEKEMTAAEKRKYFGF